MAKNYPEVFVSNAKIASQVYKELKKGQLRKLGSRVYTTNLKEPAELLVKRHLWLIVKELFPDAIIVDRTALEHRPASDGSIFIVSKKTRAVFLPGISIHPRTGHGPLKEDRLFIEKLYLSCPPRAYLENLIKRRSKKETVSRTLSREELEEKLEMLLQGAGVEALQELRDEAKIIAPSLGLKKEYKILNGLIGTLLGTHQLQLSSQVALARSQGLPYDPKRLDLFQQFYEALINTVTPVRKIKNSGSSLPFFEAYFSNFIEGTEFEVAEAFEIIFEGKIPSNRPKDAHDILGTYHIVSDLKEMKKCPKNEDELISMIKYRHALIMQGRPEVQPGKFKTVQNQAGMTLFVAPELVEGTLRKGFQWLQGLNTPFQRAVYMMFLIGEVHPFVDGNGRCSRIMMNAELVAADQARIIIPTVFRDNYISALKAISHNSRFQPLEAVAKLLCPRKSMIFTPCLRASKLARVAQTRPCPNGQARLCGERWCQKGDFMGYMSFAIASLISSLDFAQNYTSLIDWSDFDKANAMLTATHAFEEARDAEYRGVRLKLP